MSAYFEEKHEQLLTPVQRPVENVSKPFPTEGKSQGAEQVAVHCRPLWLNAIRT